MFIALLVMGVVVGVAYVFRQVVVKGKRCTSKAKLYGRTVIVTGSNTGIGKSTAIDLAKRGARVILACRNVQRGEAALVDVKKESGSNQVLFMQLDLGNLMSVRRFAETFLRSEPRLDILINNAVSPPAAGLLVSPLPARSGRTRTLGCWKRGEVKRTDWDERSGEEIHNRNNLSRTQAAGHINQGPPHSLKNQSPRDNAVLDGSWSGRIHSSPAEHMTRKRWTSWSLPRSDRLGPPSVALPCVGPGDAGSFLLDPVLARSFSHDPSKRRNLYAGSNRGWFRYDVWHQSRWSLPLNQPFDGPAEGV
ncbi:dehydrogenase/reductase SDR family member 13b.1 isoform X2 [Syngnathoides biaculeatus]|uniref:dehydrogenase/reductase SDR family member 13b.1 isoform X2 n=1 Tax=Syngnathoides biaculeatus TaxID=300417 RepID=UPI002ADDEC5D|nr:dehydrogenase/reductase SDR family member 13b.1 isoform X2 [Syngnathoides biaculeatus]